MSQRIRLLLVIAAFGLMLQTGIIAGAGESSEPATIAALIDQLSADDLQTRADAERQLRGFGSDALTALPDPHTLPSAAAEAVRRIRTHLEREHARRTLLASRVTLVGNLSLGDAIAAIAEQTGNQLEVSELPATIQNRAVTLSFHETPFWEVVRFLERQASVLAESNASRDGLTLKVQASDERRRQPAAIVGPFRVRVVGASVRPDFIDASRRLLRITLSLDVEPRLRPLFVNVADSDLAVTDVAPKKKDGPVQTFPPLSPAARHEIPVDRPGPIVVACDVILPGPSDALPVAVDVRGAFEIEIAAGRERFDFRHLDEEGAVTRRHGGVTVTLSAVQHAADELRATLRLRYDVDGPRFESHRSWVFHNDVNVTTATGTVLAPTEFETLDEGDAGVELRYRFTGVDAITDEMQLSYTAPTMIARVPVKFVIDKVTIEKTKESE